MLPVRPAGLRLACGMPELAHPCPPATFELSEETYGYRRIHTQLVRWGETCTPNVELSTSLANRTSPGGLRQIPNEIRAKVLVPSRVGDTTGDAGDLLLDMQAPGIGYLS